MDPVGGSRADLEAAIAALEGQRSTLGEAVVDLAVAPLRDRLALIDETGGQPLVKTVTVLFVDLVGSTALAQVLDAEDVTELLGDLLARFTAIVTDHRGAVFNYTGDGLVAVFGAEQASEDDAEYAIRSGLAMIDEIRTLHDTSTGSTVDGLDVRVGLDTGPAAIGGTIEGRHSLHGNTVNIAARMEQAAPVGGMRVSHDTYRLVRGLFDVIEDAPLTVKGVSEPVRSYVVHGVTPRAFRRPTRGIDGLDPEMVGRDCELSLLQEAFGQVVENRRIATVAVIGDAGLGKSRLLHEFETWAEIQPVPFVAFKGRAQPHTQREPYRLLRDVLARWLQIADSDTAAVAKQRFVDGLAPVSADEPDAAVHLLGHVIGLDFSDSPELRAALADPAQLRTRAFNAVACLLRNTARRGGTSPVVVLLDDLHWADDDTLDLLDHLATACSDVPVLVVASARPLLVERRPAWVAESPGRLRIELAPLTAGDSAELTGQLLAGLVAVPAELQEMITVGGDGNPFFMEEIVKMLLDDGTVVAADDGWAVAADRFDSRRVPSTLTGVLQARLDSLAPAERTALQQASVIGFRFWDRALAALDDRSPGHIPPLTTRGFVNAQPSSSVVDASEFAFQHHLMHQFAYDSLLKRDRRRYHGQAAAWLAELAARRGVELLGATGDHYERAGEMAAAAECFVAAAQSAAARGSQAAALGFVERALALLAPGDHDSVWRLLVVRESILALGEDRVAHRTDLDRMRVVADELDDDGRRAHAALRLAEALMNQAEHRDAEAAAHRAIALAESAGTVGVAALAHGQLTVACRRTNRISEALAHAETGLALARATGDTVVETSLLAALSGALGDAGDPSAAREAVVQALRLARDNGDRVQEARLLNHLAVDDFALGRVGDARVSWEAALALSREVDWAYGQAIVLLNLAGMHNVFGEYELGVARGTEAVSLAVSSRSRDLEAAALLHLGVALRELGRLSEAAAHLGRSCELFQLNDGAHYAVDATAALAVVHFAAGDAEAAASAVDIVLRFIEDGGDLNGLEEPFRVRWDCFRVLDAIGDMRAADLLDEAHSAALAASAHLHDDAERRRFFDALPYHRALVEAWTARR